VPGFHDITLPKTENILLIFKTVFRLLWLCISLGFFFERKNEEKGRNTEISRKYYKEKRHNLQYGDQLSLVNWFPLFCVTVNYPQILSEVGWLSVIVGG
jgi:hypothetical protein